MVGTSNLGSWNCHIYIYIHTYMHQALPHTHTTQTATAGSHTANTAANTAGASGAETSPGRCVLNFTHLWLCVYIYIKNARHHQKPYLALNKPIYFGWHGRGRNPRESTFGQHFSVFRLCGVSLVLNLMVKSFGTEALVRSPTHQWKPFWYRGTDIFARSKDQNFKD